MKSKLVVLSLVSLLAAAPVQASMLSDMKDGAVSVKNKMVSMTKSVIRATVKVAKVAVSVPMNIAKDTCEEVKAGFNSLKAN